MTKRTCLLTTLIVTVITVLSLWPAAGLITGWNDNDGSATRAASSDATALEDSNGSQSNATTATLEGAGDKKGEALATGTSSSTLTTTEFAPYPKILYPYSTTVQSGVIRYVSQKQGKAYYYTDYWGPNKPEKTRVYCKSADVSMALSYLGIELLPKDIIAACKKAGGSEGICYNYDWGTAKRYTFTNSSSMKNFLQAVDNYLNGGGVYSPPIIRLSNNSYSTKQHYVVVLAKKNATTYEILDPQRDNRWELSVLNGAFKYYCGTSPITDIYQYYLPQATQLEGASTPTTMKAGAIFVPKGNFSGNQTITNVTAGCYDMDGKPQSSCYQTAAPNSVGYDLANMSNKLKFNSLSPGIYNYVVQATVGGKARTYLSKRFTVLNNTKNIGNATFYFDSGCNVKYCTVPNGKSDGNNIDLCLTRNTESPYMRFQAEYVGGGYYTMRNVGSGRYLTVYKSRPDSGTRVIQNAMVKRDGQYWQILPTGNGNYYLVPKCATDSCLTVTSGTAAEGTKLQIKTADQSDAQSWLLRYTRTLITTNRNTSDGVQLKWDAIAGASGYRIYRKASGDSDWARVRTFFSEKTTSWTNGSVKNGTKYTYVMRSFYGSKESPTCPSRSVIRLCAPSVRSAWNSSARALTVTWSTNCKGSGYQICYATNSSFQGAKTVTVKGTSSSRKTLSGLSRGRKYYVKVRAYKTCSGATNASDWSSARVVRVVW